MTDNVQAIIDTALRSAEAVELTPGKVYALNTPVGVKQIDLTGDQYRDTPARKTGTATARDTASFHVYYAKHATDATETYADADRLTITAVLDAPTSDTPDWGQHRLRLDLRTTSAWDQWTAANGVLMEQQQFAEFLEDHLPELLEPDSATMLEIAQSFQAATKVDFQSGTRLASGERQFKYVETVNAKAGQKGDLTIPETFVVGLIPFDGAAGYKLTARLRYRIVDTDLRIGYKLDRPEDTLKTAFADVVTAVGEAIGTPIMNGTPA